MAGFRGKPKAGEGAGWLVQGACCVAIVLAGLLSAIAPARAEAPTVVVSIKPIHSLVASVMQGVGEPVLLVDGTASPHSWTMKPSQAEALSEAGIVVWIGEGMESYLASPIGSLVPEERVLELSELPSVALLPLRESGVWEPHAHEDDDSRADHDHAGYDPHLWLDPQNAIVIVRAVADRLMTIDPTNAGAYESNVEALVATIEGLDRDAVAALAPVRDVPFIVFHDAFQYFEHRYELAGVGAILLDPEQGASAARLQAIRERLADADVVCGFSEPQVDTGLLETALEGTDVRIATLDPEGLALEPGPALYGSLFLGVAHTMAACLAPQG